MGKKRLLTTDDIDMIREGLETNATQDAELTTRVDLLEASEFDNTENIESIEKLVKEQNRLKEVVIKLNDKIDKLDQTIDQFVVRLLKVEDTTYFDEVASRLDSQETKIKILEDLAEITKSSG